MIVFESMKVKALCSNSEGAVAVALALWSGVVLGCCFLGLRAFLVI
jgi:hypothetical protein